MKYWLFGSLALWIAMSVGCACNPCGDMGCGLFGGHHGNNGCANGQCDSRCGRTYSGIEGSYAGHHHGYTEQAPQGPPVGAVTYPYYTTRGPRDFLLPNPPPLGP